MERRGKHKAIVALAAKLARTARGCYPKQHKFSKRHPMPANRMNLFKEVSSVKFTPIISFARDTTQWKALQWQSIAGSMNNVPSALENRTREKMEQVPSTYGRVWRSIVLRRNRSATGMMSVSLKRFYAGGKLRLPLRMQKRIFELMRDMLQNQGKK